MADKPILVLGSTGPSGICLLRELLHRKKRVIAFVRPTSASKIPADLVASYPTDLQVVQGQVDDDATLGPAMAQCSAVISLMGPDGAAMSSGTPLPYPGFYEKHVLPLMKKHGVKRIAAMGTISIYTEEDATVFLRWIMRFGVSWMFPAAYNTMLGIAKVFSEETSIDWTVFRLPMLVGGSDEEAWKADREKGEAHAGPVSRQWSGKLDRAILAKWLADWIEHEGKWVRELPALSS
ncbi:hypothetical protein QBC40DRAFT_289701 [Triangularia verruculosa]|uniref:NAD(P)-binding domain-containing protein n=1 Tax=Triangularia verruculosa TaxID=2587418 RepID=A0AAN6X6K9_9PEZI|nr:hypothetical protein QBC40DRAFT_289701 [Triangularia verruculosa]